MTATSYRDDTRREPRRGAPLKTSADSATRAPRASLLWIVLACLLGFTVSYLLGSAASALAIRHAAPAIGENAAATTGAAPANGPAHPTFHEQFDLHPTQGDVEEPVATF